jgi:hypothetical protein
LAVPKILVKTVLEPFSPPIFRNYKKFLFSSQIWGTRKLRTFVNIREIQDGKKEER